MSIIPTGELCPYHQAELYLTDIKKKKYLLNVGNIGYPYFRMNGDGAAEILFSEDEQFVGYPSIGKDGFVDSEYQPKDETHIPTFLFADQEALIVLVGMSVGRTRFCKNKIKLRGLLSKSWHGKIWGKSKNAFPGKQYGNGIGSSPNSPTQESSLFNRIGYEWPKMAQWPSCKEKCHKDMTKRDFVEMIAITSRENYIRELNADWPY